MLPGEIAGDRKQVGVHISDGFRIFYPEHPSVDLLSQIRGVCLASEASRKKSLQSTVVSCKQPLEERFLGVSHFRPALRRATCHHPNIYRVPGPATGHPQFDSTPNYPSLRVPTRSMLHRPRQVRGEVPNYVHRLSKCLGAPENLK